MVFREPCHSSPELHSDLDWFEPSVNSARLQLRKAYNLWKKGKLSHLDKKHRTGLMGVVLAKKKLEKIFYILAGRI